MLKHAATSAFAPKASHHNAHARTFSQALSGAGTVRIAFVQRTTHHRVGALMLMIIAFQNAKLLALVRLKLLLLLPLKSHPQTKPTSCVWELYAMHSCSVLFPSMTDC